MDKKERLASDKPPSLEKEKIPPQPDLSLEQGVSARIVLTRDCIGRIRKSTTEGGLQKVPDNFNDKYGDWIVIKSVNPFEVLYLDYKEHKNISFEVVEKNYRLLESFWGNAIERIKVAPGASKQQLIDTWGGSEEIIDGYPGKLKKAYKKLKDKGIEGCFQEIDSARMRMGENQLQSLIDSVLVDGEYKPTEWNSILQEGKRFDLRDDEIRASLIKNLHSRGFKAVGEAQDLFSVRWMNDERLLEEAEGQFKAFLKGKLSNGMYNPNDYLGITENAPDCLKRDAIKLKEILLDYLKGKGFEPVKEVRSGYELMVEWKANWADEDKSGPGPGKRFRQKLVIGLVLVLGIIFVFFWIFYTNPFKGLAAKLEVEINRTLRDKGLKDVHAAVNKDLIATLRGSVSKPNDKAMALKIVKSYKDLKGVRDNIQVKPPSPGPTSDGDADRKRKSDELKSMGERSENSGNFTEALRLYGEAKGLYPSIPEIDSLISRVEKKIADQEEDFRRRKLEGDINRALRNKGVRDVHIWVNRGFIGSLRGSVDRSEDKVMALDIARSYKGLKEVRDEIQVRPSPPTPIDPIDTAKLEVEINRALRSKGLRDVYAEVNKDLTASLRGSVDRTEDKAMAFDVAKSYKDLKEVRDNIQVKPLPPHPTPDGAAERKRKAEELISKGTSSEEAEKFEEALGFYREAKEIYPDLPRINKLITDVQGKIEEEKKRKAAAGSGAKNDIADDLKEAIAAFNNSQYDVAIKICQSILRRDPVNSTAHQYLQKAKEEQEKAINGALGSGSLKKVR
jgi:osmotically-inducible protein OsmY